MNTARNIGIRTALGAMLAAVIVMATAGFAAAQDSSDPYVGPSPSVLAESELQPAEAQNAEVAGATAVQTDVEGTNLAFTGSDAVTIAAIGLAAVLVGGLILTARRRSAHA